MNPHLNEAITAIENGDKKTGRQKLRECLTAEPSNEKAWLLLESITENPRKRQDILNQILLTNPNSRTAQKRLAKIDPPSKSTIKFPDLLANSSKFDFRQLFFYLARFKFRIRYPVLTSILIVAGAVGGMLFSFASLVVGISGKQALSIILYGAVIGFIVPQVLGAWNWYTAFHIIIGGLLGIIGVFFSSALLNQMIRSRLFDSTQINLFDWEEQIVSIGSILGGIIGFIVSRNKVVWHWKSMFFIVPGAIWGMTNLYIIWRSSDTDIYGGLLFIVGGVAIGGYAGFMFYVVVESVKHFFGQSA